MANFNAGYVARRTNFPMVIFYEVDFVTAYRCYLMSGENIRAVQTLDCADDAEVILKATALLDAKPEHQNVEIWDGKRMVVRPKRLALRPAYSRRSVARSLMVSIETK